MKNRKQRVPFGAEINLVQAGAETCAHCHSPRGTPHIAGCVAEECPQCGKPLIGCCCQCLSARDETKIIQGLYAQFEDLEGALQAIGKESCPAGSTPSYLQHAVMQFIFHNVPQSARMEITRAFHLRFPALVPALQDEEGRAYYTAEQLSQALDIPLSEVNERIDAMVDAGQSIMVKDGATLRKVH